MMRPLAVIWAYWKELLVIEEDAELFAPRIIIIKEDSNAIEN